MQPGRALKLLILIPWFVLSASSQDNPIPSSGRTESSQRGAWLGFVLGSHSGELTDPHRSLEQGLYGAIMIDIPLSYSVDLHASGGLWKSTSMSGTTESIGFKIGPNFLLLQSDLVISLGPWIGLEGSSTLGLIGASGWLHYSLLNDLVRISSEITLQAGGAIDVGGGRQYMFAAFALGLSTNLTGLTGR